MKQYIAKSKMSLRLYDQEGRSKLFRFAQDRNSYVATDKWEEDVLDANLSTGLYICVPSATDAEPNKQQAEEPQQTEGPQQAEEPQQAETPQQVASEANTNKEEQAVADGNGEVRVEGVTTLHDMRKWLNEHRGIALDTLSNIQMVEKVAKEQKVVFPDYKKKGK